MLSKLKTGTFIGESKRKNKMIRAKQRINNNQRNLTRIKKTKKSKEMSKTMNRYNKERKIRICCML